MGVNDEQSINQGFGQPINLVSYPISYASIQINNRGKFFTSWEEYYPQILEGKVSLEQYTAFIKQANATRLMGRGISLVCGAVYFLFLFLYYPFLFTIGSSNCGFCFIIFFCSFFVGGAFLVVLAFFRHQKLKIRLAQLMIDYNQRLFNPVGLYLIWNQNAVPMLRIEDRTQSVYTQQHIIQQVPQYAPPIYYQTEIPIQPMYYQPSMQVALE